MRRQPYILIAEDDADDRFLLEAAFKQNELLANLCFVKDGLQVITYLDAIPDAGELPDLIVLDLNMPVLNGLETLIQLQANRRYHKVPVVMYSTSDNEKDKSYCMRCGAVKFIIKGFNFQKICASARFFYEFAVGGEKIL